MVGDYAAWDYFQSIDRAENREFVRQVQGEVRRRPRDQRRDRGGVQQRPAVGASRRRGRDRRCRRRDQGDPAAEPECAGGDRVGGRRDPAHLAAGLRRTDPGDGQFDLVWSSEKPVRPIPYPDLAVAVGVGVVSGRSVPNLGRLGQSRSRRGTVRTEPSATRPGSRRPAAALRGRPSPQGRCLATAANRRAPASPDADCHSSDDPVRSGVTSHDLATGSFRPSGPDQHHHPVAVLVPVHLADPVRRADGADARTSRPGR